MNEKDIEEKAEQFEAALEGLMCAMEELRKDRDRLKKLAERPRGRWIWMGETGDTRYMCSVCHCKENVPTIMGNPTVWCFCPNCGAKMEEEE